MKLKPQIPRGNQKQVLNNFAKLESRHDVVVFIELGNPSARGETADARVLKENRKVFDQNSTDYETQAAKFES